MGHLCTKLKRLSGRFFTANFLSYSSTKRPKDFRCVDIFTKNEMTFISTYLKINFKLIFKSHSCIALDCLPKSSVYFQIEIIIQI